MKRFLSVLLIVSALCLCCCAVDEEAAPSIESNESSESAESREESSASAEESDFSSAEETSAEPESSESADVSSAESGIQPPPVYSEVATSEPEMIPDLYLEPQPEGDYHTLYVGEEMQLYSGIVGSELEDAMLVWNISEKNIIAFSNKKVTALNPGTVTITLSYSNGLKPVSLTFVVLPAEESSEE